MLNMYLNRHRKAESEKKKKNSKKRQTIPCMKMWIGKEYNAAFAVQTEINLDKQKQWIRI